MLWIARKNHSNPVLILKSKEHCSCCNHDEYCMDNDENNDFVVCEWYLCNGNK
jgi:hypothetical protein